MLQCKLWEYKDLLYREGMSGFKYKLALNSDIYFNNFNIYFKSQKFKVIRMSIYKNIFHYYRGQTSKGSEDTKQLQIENNTTKAFINVLQNSSQILTMKLTIWLGLNGNEKDTFEYMYQVSNELHRKTPQAVVIGIAETKNMINNLQMKKYYIPDGAILSENVSILIETKID